MAGPLEQVASDFGDVLMKFGKGAADAMEVSLSAIGGISNDHPHRDTIMQHLAFVANVDFNMPKLEFLHVGNEDKSATHLGASFAKAVGGFGLE